MWTLKNKNSAAGTVESKIATQTGTDDEIQTPDGQQIFVGENEDQVLLYQERQSDWAVKTKL